MSYSRWGNSCWYTFYHTLCGHPSSKKENQVMACWYSLDKTIDWTYKEILELAWNSKHLSYLEAKYQFTLCVLEKDSYNDNIQARYFKKDLAFNL